LICVDISTFGPVAITTSSEAPSRITDTFFDQLRRQFSEAAIAELTWRIGLAGAFNRINQALDIEIESDLVQVGSASLASNA